MPPEDDNRYRKLMAGGHVWIPINDARNERQFAQQLERDRAQCRTEREIEEREADYEKARERAKLSVLPLTDRDKRFLRAMKIEC